MAKKKVHKLDNVSEQEFKLIGIASHNNDFRVSWSINKSLDINLKRSEDHNIVRSLKEVIQEFSAYYFEGNGICYTLYTNKSEMGFLLKEFKNVDFLLKLSGEVSDIEIRNVLNGLKKDEIVLAAFVIENLPISKKKLFL